MEPNLSRIKAFVFDVDGVLTDGTAMSCPGSDEAVRCFNERDGHGMRMAALNGYGLGIITGGRCESVRLRVTRFGVKKEDVYMHAKNKIVAFDDFCARHSYTREEVMYFGDDIPDVALLRYAGVGVAPADAMPEALAAADIVSPDPGGKLCARHMMERVMKEQGKWQFDVDRYDAMF